MAEGPDGRGVTRRDVGVALGPTLNLAWKRTPRNFFQGTSNDRSQGKGGVGRVIKRPNSGVFAGGRCAPERGNFMKDWAETWESEKVEKGRGGCTNGFSLP